MNQKLNWDSLIFPKRVKKYKTDNRNPFCIDSDRIIFSQHFRKMAVKTQAFPLHTGLIHTRLTHSLEVASIARSFGTRIASKLSEKYRQEIDSNILGDLLHASSLLHDIGNPPFGHKGEEAIKSWFSENKGIYLENISNDEMLDFLLFDGNAQTFRLITNVASNTDSGGMRLTFPVIASMIKYPWDAVFAKSLGEDKFSFFYNDKEAFEKIFSELGLIINNQFVRHPLSYILEAADDICYKLLDVEDAFIINILSSYDITGFVSEIMNSVNGLEGFRESVLFEKKIDHGLDFDYRIQKKLEHFRSVFISIIITEIIYTFEKYYEKVMSGDLNSNLFSLSSLGDVFGKISRFTYENVYSTESYSKVAIGANNVISILLDIFIGTAFFVYKKDTLKDKDLQVLNILLIHGVDLQKNNKNLYLMYHQVLDFITGLTDLQATNYANSLRGLIWNVNGNR